MIDNWLLAIKDVYISHQGEIDAIEDKEKKVDKLAELNVLRQVHNICHTTIVQNAWQEGKPLSIHGYSLFFYIS